MFRKPSFSPIFTHIGRNLRRLGASMTDLKSLYEQDTVVWAENQAAALRAAAKGGSNQALDWENLAEEIEDLAKNLRIGLKSQLFRIIQHHIKLTYSPASDPRRGWRRTIRQARYEIEQILDESPSLRGHIPQMIESETRQAIEYAIKDLQEYDEISGLSIPTVRRVRYSEDQILGDWFPPEREHEPPERGGQP